MLSLVVNTLMLRSLKIHLIGGGEGEAVDQVEGREI